MDRINIHKILKESDSKLLRGLPKPIVNLLARIIYQDGLNEILNKFADYKGVDFLPKVIEHLNLKVEIEGHVNLPENGKCFFVSNHPFGLIDGIILTNTIGSKYGELKAIGNEAFKFIPNLAPIIANVNVFGQNSREYITELKKVYASNSPITHFPAGIVSRVHKRKVKDKTWEKSFIKKAIENQRDVIPIRFYGRNSNLFYVIYLFRKTLRIKTNIELILLPREMFRKRNKTIKLKIGKPISHTTFNSSLSHSEWAQKIKEQNYNQ